MGTAGATHTVARPALRFPDARAGVTLWLAVAAVVLIESGRRRQPGLGIVGAVAIVIGTLWLGDADAAALGLAAPSSWPNTVALAALLGASIQLLSVIVIEPLAERLTGQSHDLSLVESVRSSWWALLQWLAVVWVVVAFVEELIFRGFLLGGAVEVFGDEPAIVALAVVGSALVFGLAHLYQGPAGAVSTGLVGAILGVLFVGAGYNVWLPVVTHGVIDTVGLALIATGRAERLARLSPLAAREDGG